MCYYLNMKNKQNYIYIHKKDGSIKRANGVFGLWIKFKGENSIVNIYEPCNFKFRIGVSRSHIVVNGDNNVINIQSNTKTKIKSLRIKAIGSNNTINIGKNLNMSDGVTIDFANTSNLELNIGDNCLFGQNIKMMLGDHHKIYSLEDNKMINVPKSGIDIGDNVWLARNVTLLKDVKISKNSVVGYGSTVTKRFEQENALIVGSPAKIVKENIYWQY